jgi:predicted house-cleaning noncanonical NTP pyrophosphatase (MazG superfamily)
MPGKVYYNKLIRDNIADKIRSKGEACEVRELTDDQEFNQELMKKLLEEATELSRAQSKEEFIDEMADLMAVIGELTRVLGVTPAELAEATKQNHEKKGGFKKRHFLHWSEDSGYKSNETPQGVQSSS